MPAVSWTMLVAVVESATGSLSPALQAALREAARREAPDVKKRRANADAPAAHKLLCVANDFSGSPSTLCVDSKLVPLPAGATLRLGAAPAAGGENDDDAAGVGRHTLGVVDGALFRGNRARDPSKPVAFLVAPLDAADSLVLSSLTTGTHGREGRVEFTVCTWPRGAAFRRVSAQVYTLYSDCARTLERARNSHFWQICRRRCLCKRSCLTTVYCHALYGCPTDRPSSCAAVWRAWRTRRAARSRRRCCPTALR